MIKILNQDFASTKLFFILGEATCIVCSIFMAMFVRFGANFYPMAIDIQVWGKILLVVFICQLSLYYNDLYDFRIRDTYMELGLRLVQAMGISSISLAAIYYAFPSTMLGRGVFLISIIFLFILVSSWRYLYSWTLKKQMFSEHLMIIGSGDLAQSIVHEIASRQDSGYRIVAVFDNPNANVDAASPMAGRPIFSGFDEIYDRAVELSVRKVVVALQENRGKFPVKELLRCKMAGIQVLDGIDFYEGLAGKILVEALRPSWLIFSQGFKKSRMTRTTKRLTGIVLSALGIIITFPFSLLGAVWIKLDSPGPIFYSQIRSGEGGNPFRLYKFRSMSCDAENDSGAVWAEEDDPRITKAGRIMRKLRIDEIPQMWNVLKGDMSFVGPRPERPEFVSKLEKIIPFYQQRMNVKPGITGWAQVSYPYAASIRDAGEKLKYDLFYIKNMNFVFDLTIMLQTIKIILWGRGAR